MRKGKDFIIKPIQYRLYCIDYVTYLWNFVPILKFGQRLSPRKRERIIMLRTRYVRNWKTNQGYNLTNRKIRSDSRYYRICGLFIFVNRIKTEYYELQSSERKGTRMVRQKYDGTKLWKCIYTKYVIWIKSSTLVILFIRHIKDVCDENIFCSEYSIRVHPGEIFK